MTRGSFEVRPFPRGRQDIVDGAPAARFVRRLREIVENAEVLRRVQQVTERWMRG